MTLEIRSSEFNGQDSLQAMQYAAPTLSRVRIKDPQFGSQAVGFSNVLYIQPEQHVAAASAPSRLQITAPVKALVTLSEFWGLTDGQMNVLLGYRTDRPNWPDVIRGEDRLDNTVDRVDRVRILLSIDGLLQGMYGDEAGAQTWLHRPNAALGGRSPIEQMLKGKLLNLYEIVDHLRHLTTPVASPDAS